MNNFKTECSYIPYEIFDNAELLEVSITIEDFDIGSSDVLKSGYVGRLKKLKKLDLTGIRISNEIFKNEICELTDLKELTLLYADISSIPEEICQLKQLEKLILRGNHITDIPDSISKLINIIEINLIGNSIKHIPKSLLNLSKLKELILRDNPISGKYSDLIDEDGYVDLAVYRSKS